jgi:hypothetical protein
VPPATGGPFQTGEIAAKNCLSVTAANKRVWDEGREHR